ncbi:helix-turn-helix transcriptional regulator [Acaryochloris marina]|uniref:Transcriptional regulator, AraC family n=1 Tax=Acaryochloris marina (strain MBIC 11017) TaxID=329726 RepID=A8ZKH6_ACAM1|nr:AraC family transcriptional regulator [Acaryochloris marina]ABW31676.1 transcriptional regulator, AraC family [Acaryochloris marina MBIC11017]
MQVHLTAPNFCDLVQNVAQQVKADLQETELLQQFQFPVEFGQGWVQRLNIRPGVTLTLERMTLFEPLTILASQGMSTSTLDICFCLSGQVQGSHWDSHQTTTLSANRGCLGFSPEIRGCLEYASAEPVQLVNIGIDIHELASVLHHPVEMLPLALQHSLLGNSQCPYIQHFTTTTASQVALQQILNCPYNGLPRRLYLESRVIELLAHLLQSLSPSTASSSKLSPDDIERIYAASEILKHQLEHPPSLLQLAHQVGLNDYKLKLGFREVFDTTAFGYLWSVRMQEAALLLKRNRMGVTEVALSVGYSSATSFSAAFKRKFGTSPQKYRQHC